MLVYNLVYFVFFIYEMPFKQIRAFIFSIVTEFLLILMICGAIGIAYYDQTNTYSNISLRTSLADMIWYCIILLVIFTLIAIAMEFFIKTIEMIKQKRNKIAVDPKGAKDFMPASDFNPIDKMIDDDEENNKIMDSAKE